MLWKKTWKNGSFIAFLKKPESSVFQLLGLSETWFTRQNEARPLGDVKQNSPPFFRRHKQAILSYLTNLNSLLKKSWWRTLSATLHSRPKRPWLEKKSKKSYFVIFVTTTSDRVCCWGKSSSPRVMKKNVCSQETKSFGTSHGPRRGEVPKGSSWIVVYLGFTALRFQEGTNMTLNMFSES